MNFYSESRFKEYQEHGWVFTALCTGCLLLRRHQRTAALERPIEKATAPKVQDAGTMTEAAPEAEKADKIAATKAAEAHLKVEEQKESAKAAKDAEEVAKAALNAEETKAEKSAVIPLSPPLPSIRISSALSSPNADEV